MCLYSEQNPWQDSCASLAWIDKLSLCRSQLHEFCGENILLILLKGCMKGYNSTHIQFYSLAKNHHLDRKTCWKVDNSAGLSGYLHSVCLDMLHVPVHLRNFWDKLIQPHICRLMWAWEYKLYKEIYIWPFIDFFCWHFPLSFRSRSLRFGVDCTGIITREFWNISPLISLGGKGGS